MPDLIGQTPLMRLRLFERELPGIELYAKAEWRNPGGSVKDRAAGRIVREAASDDYRFHAVILGIVTSDPFLMRRSQS